MPRALPSGLACLACLMLLACSSASAKDPRGVEPASMTGWDIVVDAEAIESERYAAEQFRDRFAEATGITLPITNEPQGGRHHVYIGPGRAMRDSPVGFGVDDLGPEDLRIVARDDNIAIAGGRPRGTLYGVYTFVEDYLGVRFLTADHTHVPRVAPDAVIGPIDRTYRPPMNLRWVSYEANYADPAFCARLRLNAARVPASRVGDTRFRNLGPYGGRTPQRRTEHTFHRTLPPEVYAKEHPEYYCLFKGERMANAKEGESDFDFKRGQFPYGMQPCLTHPEVKRIITERALEELASHPDRLNVAVSQNDGGAHCQCDKCLPIDEREGTKAGTILLLVNEIADVVAREHPDRLVSTIAYSDSAAPPKTLRPRENVQILWCSIGTCFIHAFDDSSCEQNAWHIAQLRKWAELTDRLYVWNYYLNDEKSTYQLPMPNLQLIDDNIRFQRSLGVRGMFMQATSSSHGNEWEELRNYLLSNLLWDPTRDGEELMDEWLDLHYGPAAPPIRKWIGRLHDRSVASGRHCRCLGGSYEDYGLDETDVQAGLDAFEEAMRLAGDDAVLRGRVEKASIMAWRAALEPIWYVGDDERIDPALARRMGPLTERFFELCRRHGVTRTKELAPHRIEIFERRLRAVLERSAPPS